MTLSNVLAGDNVRLTALSEDDLPTIAGWYDDALFGRLFDARPARPRTPAALKKWLADAAESPTEYLFGVRPLAEDRLLGIVDVDDILWSQRVGWLAYAIGHAADRRQGIGTEAVTLGITFAFHELNLHRVSATVFAYNPASIALLERLGFTREGAFRSFIERDGRRHDMLLYGLLRPEWEARA